MSLWGRKNPRGKLFKSHDYPEYEFFRVQVKLLTYRLMKYNPELIRPEFHKELSAHPLHLKALEKRYLFLCKKLNKPNTIVGVLHKAGLDKSGVRMYIQQYGTDTARQKYPFR